MSAIPAVKKRRGVIRASITRLATKLKDLEGRADQASTFDLAQGMAQKLDSLDVDFRKHHFELIDLIDEEDTLSREQKILDDHDDDVASLSALIKQLMVTCSSSVDSSHRKTSSKKLIRLERNVESISTAIDSSADTPDVCLLQQCEEQLKDLKAELASVLSSLLAMDLDDSDDLCVLQMKLEDTLFNCGLKIKKLLASTRTAPGPTTSVDGKGVRLPKLDVPTFDGQVINWTSFWEQFDISIHSRSALSDTEKLVYLKNSLKDGTAKGVIEGLSRSGEHYKEAIKSLKARYDRPRLIHQTHVRLILEAVSLKEGTGRELRRLHDTVQQHLRALKAMDYEPSGPFITSVLELKLDVNTMFEWQKVSIDSSVVPHYQDLLDFINLRAQASESSVADVRKGAPMDRQKKTASNRPIASFAAHTSDPACTLCKSEKHHLFACPQFKSQSHEEKLTTLKSRDACINCLRPGHFIKQCKSMHRCKVCQKPHHTLLHIERGDQTVQTPTVVTNVSASVTTPGLSSCALLMTCRMLVRAPDGSSMEARALLDSASSASFVSERLAQCLRLPRLRRGAKIMGVGGLSHESSTQAITRLVVSPTQDHRREINVTAVIMPQVTCDLPLQPVLFNPEWTHLSDLTLADPDFGQPDRIDILLGVDVFVQVMRQGRRTGLPGSPSAFETDFGWVLAGDAGMCVSNISIVSHHTSVVTGDQILQRFWEIEELPSDGSSLSPEERMVVQHFQQNHTRTESGRFIVPLPKKPQAKSLGESRSQAVRRFLFLERSLKSKGQWAEFSAVIAEYFEQDHAELVPTADLEKPTNQTFYLPMHVVRKESSSTTKVRAVFDASAVSSSGVSLNDTLLVGPTVHSSLTDVLLRFRLHRIALTTDVSRMYRAVLLDEADRDLHRFVWRASPSEPLRDYRMTRVTFGIAASSYAANMAIKQNALDLALEFPSAARVVNQSFYVDDGLTGADSVEKAVDLQKELQTMFDSGGFILRKWNSSNPAVLRHIPDDLKESQSLCTLPEDTEFTKTLGIEWNSVMDHFRLTIAELPPLDNVTKRFLASDISKTFDVLGWFSPCTIKMKILFQQLWEMRVEWDDPVPEAIRESWLRWRSELNILSTKHIPRCYFDKTTHVSLLELHGFSDASERAYAAVVYMRMVCVTGDVQVALIASKTKVAPIKKLTIPRLELCGANLLSQLLHHIREVFNLPLTQSYAWTDSTIVLSWLSGNPKRFKTYVCNRVSNIIELIGPECWRHVSGVENPADCASRGVFPSEILDHDLWWNGPHWLKFPSSEWPCRDQVSVTSPVPEEEREVSLHGLVTDKVPVIALDCYSSFCRLTHVTAWVRRFIRNCQAKLKGQPTEKSPYLLVQELRMAEAYWYLVIQEKHFMQELSLLRKGQGIPHFSPLISLHPILDQNGLLRVGGRESNSKGTYASQHPIILHSAHPVARLIIRTEHVRLLHAGPTLLTCALNRRYHIVGGRRAVRSVTRGCIICRRTSVKPQDQLMGQLPSERVSPDLIFSKVGLDYAGPFCIKLGHTRRPTIVKAYACLFVSLSVKAVHIELVSDLTSAAFLACLRRFIARRGKPTLLWSDHGTNFVGASRELKELADFLTQQKTQKAVSEFCATQHIQWKFIPEHAPHFGGLWEAAVRSMKTHLRRIVSGIRLTFEELTTVLAQVEACLNSRPLVAVPSDDDGIEALTPGHFLIGRPLEALPNPPAVNQSISLLRRWHLCQGLLQHFWKRWSSEYLASLRKIHKWHQRTRNIAVGDVVLIREDGLVPTKWPLARVTEVYPGKDNIVRVVQVKTSTGTYTRPITKIACLLPVEH